MRVRITNLINELHHQAARFLVDNFDLILLPTFETSDMVQRGKRKIRSKSVRSMLTFAHYRFQQFLLWKAGETGKQVLLVNEAYTSKTCSWNGEIIAKLGGQRWIQSSDGFRVERDINGARGIFLRALGDTPSLMQSACIATGVVNVGWRKSIGAVRVNLEIPVGILSSNAAHCYTPVILVSLVLAVWPGLDNRYM